MLRFVTVPKRVGIHLGNGRPKRAKIGQFALFNDLNFDKKKQPNLSLQVPHANNHSSCSANFDFFSIVEIATDQPKLLASSENCFAHTHTTKPAHTHTHEKTPQVRLLTENF